jgi:hypothetical protein
LYFQEQLKPWEIFLQAWIFQYQTSSKSTYIWSFISMSLAPW